jgi:hypothetical protein
MISLDERRQGEPSEETVAAVVKGADPAAERHESLLTRAINLVKRGDHEDTDDREIWLTSTQCKLIEHDHLVASCDLASVRAMPIQPAPDADDRHILTVVTTEGDAIEIEGEAEDLTRFAVEVRTALADLLESDDIVIDLRNDGAIIAPGDTDLLTD